MPGNDSNINPNNRRVPYGQQASICECDDPGPNTQTKTWTARAVFLCFYKAYCVLRGQSRAGLTAAWQNFL